MAQLNRLFVLVLATLCLAACANGGGYRFWEQNAPEEALDAPSSLSAPQIANGGSNTMLAPGDANLTTNSLEQQPLTGFEPRETASLSASELPPFAAAAAPVKVAILLPLSGKDAALGNAMLQSAQMALFDIGQNAFELLPRDTATGARAAAQGAIAEGAKLILGPVFAADVREAKAVAQAANINMISFSTDWTVAGGNTFIMGFMPFDQVNRVIDYASSQGVRHIGLIAPNSQYGNAVISSYRMKNPAAAPGDVTILPASTGELPATVQSLAQKSAAAPYDAILMPFGGNTAGVVGDLLTKNGLTPDRVKRLGTGLWEDTSLVSSAGLAGGWFAAPSPANRSKFESRYQKLYAAAPPRLASLAYDATALASVLAQSGNYDRSAITNPNGFTGVDGIFRFRNDGLAERGLAILEFKAGRITVIDESPRTFQSSMR